VALKRPFVSLLPSASTHRTESSLLHTYPHPHHRFISLSFKRAVRHLPRCACGGPHRKGTYKTGRVPWDEHFHSLHSDCPLRRLTHRRIAVISIPVNAGIPETSEWILLLSRALTLLFCFSARDSLCPCSAIGSYLHPA